MMAIDCYSHSTLNRYSQRQRSQINQSPSSSMGNTISLQQIAYIAKAIFDEFNDTDTMSMMFSSITAPSKCREPASQSEVHDHLRCIYYGSQRSTWYLILTLIGLLAVLTLVQSIYIYNKLKTNAQKLVSTRLNSEMTNVQMMSVPSRPTNNVIIDLDAERGRGTITADRSASSGCSNNPNSQNEW